MRREKEGPRNEGELSVYGLLDGEDQQGSELLYTSCRAFNSY